MVEIALEIKTFGAPVLRQRAAAIPRVTDGHRQLLSRMAGVMYDAGGIGLAAPQVGVAECMIVVDIGSGLYKLINPVVTKRKGRQVNQEGCLSVPGVCIKVRRARSVRVEARDECGLPLTIDADDLLACVLQHEIDHLRGKLLVDYASFFEKARIKRRLKLLKSRSRNDELSESKKQSCPLQL